MGQNSAIEFDPNVEIPARHKLALAHFRKWKSENPKVKRAEVVKMFDFLIDTAQMNEAEKSG